MSVQSIEKYLADHGIRTRYNHRGELQGEELYSIMRNGRSRDGRGWVTMTGKGISQVRTWLGY